MGDSSVHRMFTHLTDTLLLLLMSHKQDSGCCLDCRDLEVPITPEGGRTVCVHAAGFVGLVPVALGHHLTDSASTESVREHMARGC